ncbi:unnamed protein product [Leptidea sinapis]|uniref:Uncharacterized protein n=1 Tax=Leptidea sinapis TaxID=189913 RepID=A0A5E4PQJ5_9NEOP|nr:unnamed protein product [Leptidea sinapis]
MQMLATLIVAWLASGARGVIRTPLEAFRPSAEIHIRRPDKLPFLPHRRTASMQQKNGLKVLYQTDAAWTIFSLPDSNATQQIVNCHCPKSSVTYLLKKLPYTTPSGEQGNMYQFACSPQSRLRCSRKEPCRLFSARRRHEQIDEVNASTICQCPREHTCPKHHTEPGVLPGITYIAEDIRTYHGYCLPEPSPDTYRFVGDKD